VLAMSRGPLGRLLPLPVRSVDPLSTRRGAPRAGSLGVRPAPSGPVQPCRGVQGERRDAGCRAAGTAGGRGREDLHLESLVDDPESAELTTTSSSALPSSGRAGDTDQASVPRTPRRRTPRPRPPARKEGARVHAVQIDPDVTRVLPWSLRTREQSQEPLPAGRDRLRPGPRGAGTRLRARGDGGRPGPARRRTPGAPRPRAGRRAQRRVGTARGPPAQAAGGAPARGRPVDGA
jgi:hypothetical protein